MTCTVCEISRIQNMYAFYFWALKSSI